MSVGYKAIQWSPHIRRYDLVIALGVLLYMVLFVVISKLTLSADRAISDPILILRALGSCAYLLLHVVLCIGPLARLDKRFLPLLFNRRHLGVITFMLGLLHALLVLVWYHSFGSVSPIHSLLTSNTSFTSLSAFPFELLGAGGLVILFLMAATSHDFWLKNLSPATWKRLHMLVYVAWALLVMHVMLGAIQSERSVLYPVVVIAGVALVCGLHLAAGRREVKQDRCNAQKATAGADDANWIDVACVDDIAESRAHIACLPGQERIAIFRHGNKLSALTNVCAHQGGPLGEGRIVDGCVTCPWHGYQYRPEDGSSPPPFTERVSTFRLRVQGRRVLVNRTPLPPGTFVEPATFEPLPDEHEEHSDEQSQSIEPAGHA